MILGSFYPDSLLIAFVPVYDKMLLNNLLAWVSWYCWVTIEEISQITFSWSTEKVLRNRDLNLYLDFFLTWRINNAKVKETGNILKHFVISPGNCLFILKPEFQVCWKMQFTLLWTRARYIVVQKTSIEYERKNLRN